MGDFGLRRGEQTVRSAAFLLCLVFALITLVVMLTRGKIESILMAAATVVLVCAPLLVQRLLRRTLSTPLYLFCLLYAVGPMLGVCYNFYYHITWWDKMLHIFGGLSFAVFGIYLFELLGGEGEHKVLMTALFALSFSIAISAVWEFAEFGADQFLGMDMQSDRVIHSIRSYFIGASAGETGTIEQIRSVAVDGRTLPVNGYLDIGLTDTMLDMLLESGGALLVSLLYLTDRGRQLLLKQKGEENG